jgi:hypothetical protein
MTLDIGEKDGYGDEQPSLFHVLKARKRQTQQTIHLLRINNNDLITTREILCIPWTSYDQTIHDMYK